MNRCKIAGRNTDTRSETLVAIGLSEPSQALAEGDFLKFLLSQKAKSFGQRFNYFKPSETYCALRCVIQVTYNNNK